MSRRPGAALKGCFLALAAGTRQHLRPSPRLWALQPFTWRPDALHAMACPPVSGRPGLRAKNVPCIAKAIEAFHSKWHNLLGRKCKSNLCSIFDCMDELYHSNQLLPVETEERRPTRLGVLPGQDHRSVFCHKNLRFSSGPSRNTKMGRRPIS